MLSLGELPGGASYRIPGQSIVFLKLGHPIRFRLYDLDSGSFIFREINTISEDGAYCSMHSNIEVTVIQK